MSLKSMREQQKQNEQPKTSSKSSTIIQEQMTLIKDQQDEITRLKSQIEQMKEQTKQQKSSEISRLQKEAERVPKLLEEISKLNEKIGTQSESDLIEKQNSELQKENGDLQRKVTAVSNERDNLRIAGQKEHDDKVAAQDASAEANRKRRAAESREKYISLQRNRLTVALAVFWGFLAVLSYEPILDSLYRLIEQIKGHYVAYGIGAGVALILIAFAIYNQSNIKEHTKKEHYDQAVWNTNTAFIIALGAVTGFYKHVPILTYPECLIVLVVAYQFVKLHVKSKNTL